MSDVDFSYSELANDLEIRIDAHKRYSEFSLEDFLISEFHFDGKRVLDLGCGGGNLTSVMAGTAKEYVGVDKNRELIEQASSQFNAEYNISFINADLDALPSLQLTQWDLIFFIFSAYYTNNPESLFNRCYSLLNSGGQIILIGPSSGNAVEIDQYCLEMFGKEVSTSKRAGRISKEFAPLLTTLGFEISLKSVNFDLLFPSYQEYLSYISSTLQFREASEPPFDDEKSRGLLEDEYSLRLTKQVDCLCGRK
jgi:ubiquinone/menaquinone biosynthesis C-methylase UbiE